MQALAFVLLIGALLSFILSTRQLPLARRLVIWGIGVALLSVATFLIHKNPIPDSLIPAFVEAVRHPADSLLARALSGNISLVGTHFVLLFDFSLIFGIFLALLALIAFTPGERVERITRPLCLMALGAVVGGVAALAVVAIGFGGYPKREVYFGILHEEDIVDGDTFRLGDVSMRLAGINAPEIGQECSVSGKLVPCGRYAKVYLSNIAKKLSLVICDRVPGQNDKYGRPLVQCKARTEPHGEADIAEQIASNGHAVAYEESGEPDPTYLEAIQKARANALGIWEGCTLKPSVWLGDRVARDNFVTPPFAWAPNDVIDEARCPQESRAGTATGPK